MIVPTILPGSETRRNVAAGLELLVDELNDLMSMGMEVEVDGETTTAYVRLYNFTGDLMSAFRVIGGTGCGGNRPCSFCEFEPTKETHNGTVRKSFATDPSDIQWRTDESVANQLKEIKENSALSTEYGLMYSPLQKLDHFSIVHSIGIDLLHLLVSECLYCISKRGVCRRLLTNCFSPFLFLTSYLAGTWCH